MKKQVINFSWPATLSFSAESKNENERFSRGKLEVFYKGETADHRFFSDEFSKELIKSLPYTPIVSHYDEEKDDFVGHATQQDIYGIVDPCGEITFKEGEDGNVWCVCDTVYYTERPDKVGEIAKKIAGHSQSLELDPSTVKYTINYDERRHFKNVEFTAGKFIGVSVLGKDQKPAFTGSSFFSCEDFDAKMKILRDYCQSQHDQKTNGGIEMNLQEFMKLSWGDISVKVEEAICAEYREEYYTYIVDMFEDNAIVRFYSYIDESSKLMRVKYSCDENGTITLGDVNEVHITYEDVQTKIEETGVKQATLTESSTNSDDFKKDIDDDKDDIDDVDDKDDVDDVDDKDDDDMGCNPEDKKDKDMVCNPDKKKDEDMVCNPDKKKDEDMICNPEDKKDKKTNCSEVVDAACAKAATDAAQVTNAEVTETTKKVSVANEEIEKENSSTTSFTESERAELNSLKREKKVNLLNSFKEYLTSEEYADYESRIDTFEVETLEVELLKKYKAHKEEEPKNTMRAFALFTPQKENARNTLDDFVRRNLNR